MSRKRAGNVAVIGLCALLGCSGELPTRRVLLVDGSAGPAGERDPGAPATGEGKLCDPCTSSVQCGGVDDLCLSGPSGETFCSRSCSSSQPCPVGWSCGKVSQYLVEMQCFPPKLSCGHSSDMSPGHKLDASPGGPKWDVEPSGKLDGSPGGKLDVTPPIGKCDPGFLGPFCSGSSQFNQKIIGFDDTPANPNPTLAEVRQYSLDAVNYIRARTCLPPLAMDSCLNDIAAKALAANAGHGYFLANCMNAQHGYGKKCQCDWAQENIGAAGGTGLSWKMGIHVPLCGMMSEPKGVGHRSNIESKEWTRMGVGVEVYSSGASWFHEFGR